MGRAEPVEQPKQTFGRVARYAGVSERVTVQDGVDAECGVMDGQTDREKARMT